jgi:hypothetical protein
VGAGHATAIDQVTQLMASEVSGHAARRAATSTKTMMRKAVLDDLKAIELTARGLERRIPHVAQRFVVPFPLRDQELLAVARSVAQNAKALEAEFLTQHMPKDFLEDLATDIAGFEAAAREQESGRQTHKMAHQGIEVAMAAALEAVEELDGIVANEFRNNTEELRKWADARRVDKSPRRTAADPAEPAAETGTNAEATPTS